MRLLISQNHIITYQEIKKTTMHLEKLYGSHPCIVMFQDYCLTILFLLLI